MSQESVETMEAAYAAIARNDLDAFLALAHPEIEFRSLIAEVDDRTYRGHDGVREWWESVIRALGIRPEPETIDAFRDRGITRLRLAAHVAGVEVPQTMWLGWRVRDGLLLWWATFRTEPEALDAVGLSEQRDPAPAISRDNVEIVRGVYAEWERGNFQAALPLFDPDITFETFMPDANENVVSQGLDETASFMRDWFGQWRRYRVIGDEFRAAGSDQVFVGGRQAATGLHSGVEVESPGFTVWTFRRGKVVKLLFHYDRHMALRAVGLAD